MINIAAAFACVLIFTFVGVMEKFVTNKHHLIDMSLSRVFYMLIMVLIVIIIYNPKVLSSQAMRTAFKDPALIAIGLCTTLGMFLYYWLLERSHLYLVSLLWPMITILTILAACIFIKESLSVMQWIGVALTFIGICMTVLK
jgi:drug/metabolite transporter (DMT)-like permease